MDVLAHIARRVSGSAAVEIDDRDRVLGEEHVDVPELSVGLNRLQPELSRRLFETIGLLEERLNLVWPRCGCLGQPV